MLLQQEASLKSAENEANLSISFFLSRLGFERDEVENQNDFVW